MSLRGDWSGAQLARLPADLLTRLIPPQPLPLTLVVTDPKQPIPAANPSSRTLSLSRFALQSYLAYVQSQYADTDHVSSNRCNLQLSSNFI